jgi:hypothetical protein
VPPNQTSVAHGNSAMSLDSRQTVLGPTSRPVVTAAGLGIDEARFPRSPSIECHPEIAAARMRCHLPPPAAPPYTRASLSEGSSPSATR